MAFSVCFVCTGNICRSPMAESVMRARVEEAGLSRLVRVDSAGTNGWHEGDGADPRTVTVLKAAGHRSDHVARRFQVSWFPRLDLVIALDSGHLRALRRLAPTPADADKVRLLRSYDPSVTDLDGLADLDVPDPYYGEADGFDACLRMVEASSDGLLDAIREEMEGRAA